MPGVAVVPAVGCVQSMLCVAVSRACFSVSLAVPVSQCATWVYASICSLWLAKSVRVEPSGLKHTNRGSLRVPQMQFTTTRVSYNNYNVLTALLTSRMNPTTLLLYFTAN